MTDVVLENVSRFYGVKAAVQELALTINSGEFVSLLGPSGSGKTTTLSLISGLDQPTSGTIRIGDEVVAHGERGFAVLPEDRDLGLVPQSYALWPHMTVAGNVGFPLRLRRVGRRERQDRIEEALALVDMADYLNRYPHELSGGQQQRVAIARTLIYKPKVLLLDEPLSNLDAKLRDRARIWLRRLQRDLGVTTIFVTHDQAEALSLSDRIVVMEDGRIVQVDSPENIYLRPATPFVADFVGGCSFLTGTVAGVAADGRLQIAIDSASTISLPASSYLSEKGARVTLAIRPEWATLATAGAATPDQSTIRVNITGYEFAGGRFFCFGQVGDQFIRFESPSARSGEAWLSLAQAKIILFPAG